MPGHESMTDPRTLTIALAKGRLADQTFDLLERMGVDCAEARSPGRQLVLWDRANDIRFVLVKPSDVPTYVAHGVADLGVVGKDTLLEAGLPLYELLDLGFGCCRLCVVGYAEAPGETVSHATFRVATKFPRIAGAYYAEKSREVELIRLNGSIELAPILGLSDVIVDIVETGRTLKENGLAVLETVCPISARLVANPTAYRFRTGEITELAGKLSTQVTV